MSDLKIDLSGLGMHSGGPDGAGRGPDDSGQSFSGSGPRKGGRRRWGRRIGWAAVLACLAISGPFVLLLRGSVHAHGSWGFGPWGSVGVGLVFATVAAGSGVWLVSRVLAIPGGLRRLLVRAGMVLGLVFVGYGVLYIGARNMKGDAVRSEYRALHPLLRVASTALVLVDRDAVVTDARRHPDDYLAMGLTPMDASDHYPQSDGYVHALDLRTRGRPAWRNRLVEWTFRLMGFRVLRHVGTADHLHISLPPRGVA